MSNFDLLEFHRLAMADAPRLGAPHAALGSMVATSCIAATAQKQRTIVLERRIEEQAAEITVANDRLRQVLASAIDAWIAVDDQQTIVLSKKAAAEMFGCDVDEAIGSPVSRFIPEPVRADHAGQVGALSRTPLANRSLDSSPTMNLLRANQERFVAETSISHAEVGGRSLATVVMRDISERQAAELGDGLGALGWEIVGPAPTVADALRLIEITPNIHAAILNINLGRELVHPVAECPRSLGVPFVCCAGYEQPSLEGRRAEDTTIRKPVNMRLLTQHLQKLKHAA